MPERASFEEPVQERILELRRVPAFRALPARVALELACAIDVDARTDGSRLMSEGEPLSEVIWILRGSALWVKGDRALGRGEDGASVGLLEVLAGVEAQATVHARGEVVVARLGRERLVEELEDSFDLVDALLSSIASELCAAGRRSLARAACVGAPADALPAEVDFTERLVRLRMSRPFVRAPIRSLASLAQRGEVVRWPRGATLWERGATAREVAVVLAGEVREGQATLRAGETLGLLEALAGRKRDAAAHARAPLVALVLGMDALVDVLEDDEELAIELLRACADELLAERLSRGMVPDVLAGPPDRSLPRVVRVTDTVG